MRVFSAPENAFCFWLYTPVPSVHMSSLNGSKTHEYSASQLNLVAYLSSYHEKAIKAL